MRSVVGIKNLLKDFACCCDNSRNLICKH